MPPVYFLPRVSAGQIYDPITERLNRKTLQAHGLLGIFGDLRGRADISISDGKLINGGSGCLLACGAPDKFTRPDSLEWLEGDVWIGCDPEAPPSEPDLRRKRQVGGYRIDGDDGSSWLVPIIRRPDDTTEMPCDMYYENGVLKEPVKEAYREYWEATAEVAGWFFNGDGESFTRARGLDLAVKALGINYRFGHMEQRVCKVVTSENFLAILGYTVDYPRYSALSAAEKKSTFAPDTVITTLGPDADCVTTDLPAQTSGLAP